MYFNLCIVVFVITEYLSSRCQFSSFLINWNFRSYLICKYSPWNEKVQGFLKHQFIQMKSTLDVTVKHSATLNYTLVFMSVAVGTSLIISSSNWRIFFFSSYWYCLSKTMNFIPAFWLVCGHVRLSVMSAVAWLGVNMFCQ